MSIRVFVCALVLTASCDQPAHDPAADLRLAIQQPSVGPSIQRSQAAMQPGGCLSPGEIRLRGVLRREIHLGPPGYGENPATDERDTVIALILPARLALCRDSVAGGRPAPPLVGRRISLWHVTKSALDAVGQTVTVYGVLHEANFAHEFGPLVMQVDSVPDLRPPPPTRAT